MVNIVTHRHTDDINGCATLSIGGVSWIFLVSWPVVPIGRLSTISPMVGIFVYYKNMQISDQFQVTLTSQEYDQLQEMFSFCAQFEFTEHNDPEIFDRLWDKVLDADHEIKFEEVKSWAWSANSIQVCWIRVTASEKSESLASVTKNESPQIGSTGRTKNIWNLCTIF